MSFLSKPRLRVPCHTRLAPSASRSLASLTASNTAANSSGRGPRPINPLTIQAGPPSTPGTPLTPSMPNTPTPAAANSTFITSYPFPSSSSSTFTGSSPAGQHVAKTQRRSMHSSHARRAQKGAEKRDEMKTESTEFSKSGTDAQAAKQMDAAFEPGRNDPQDQLEKAGEGADGNPLQMSPANHAASKPADDAATGGDSKEGGRSKPSGGGSPNKGGKGPGS